MRKQRKGKERKGKEKERKGSRLGLGEKKKRSEREVNAGAARSAAGGRARGACSSRSPRAHGPLPAIPIAQRLPGARAGGHWETVRVPAGPGRREHAA